MYVWRTYIYICTYVCTYVCMYICTYVWIYICMFVCTTYVYMYVCTYVCVYVWRMYTCVCIYMYVCMHICLYVCMYYVRMYVCNHDNRKSLVLSVILGEATNAFSQPRNISQNVSRSTPWIWFKECRLLQLSSSQCFGADYDWEKKVRKKN